jgi:quinol monooxygenase YgiN
MIIVAGTIDVDPDRRDEFLGGRVESMQATQTEPGCLDYVMSADPIRPGVVLLFERWEDADALDVHLRALREQPRDEDGAASAVRGADITRYEISASGPITG